MEFCRVARAVSVLQPGLKFTIMQRCIPLGGRRRPPRLALCAARPLACGAAPAAARLGRGHAHFARTAVVALRLAAIIRARARRPASALAVSLHPRSWLMLCKEAESHSEVVHDWASKAKLHLYHLIAQYEC